MAAVVGMTRQHLPHVRRNPGVRQFRDETMAQTVERELIELMSGITTGRDGFLFDVGLGHDLVELDAQAIFPTHLALRQRRTNWHVGVIPRFSFQRPILGHDG